MKINNYVGFTDISACFDRIIPSIISLLNKKCGCPESATQLHAMTIKHSKYHLRTSKGVSADAYSHGENTPIYGNGQGAGDSPSQWNLESVMLFEIFQQFHSGATITSPQKTDQIKVPLASFADDTNIFGNDETHSLPTSELAQEASDAFLHWNKLLHAAGHSLELSKCACYLTIWEFDEDGKAFPLKPDEHRQVIKVQDTFRNIKEIQQLVATTLQKILGTMKNPLGAQQDEADRLLRKSNGFAEKINLHHLTRPEAYIAHETFYI